MSNHGPRNIHNEPGHGPLLRWGFAADREIVDETVTSDSLLAQLEDLGDSDHGFEPRGVWDNRPMAVQLVPWSHIKNIPWRDPSVTVDAVVKFAEKKRPKLTKDLTVKIDNATLEREPFLMLQFTPEDVAELHKDRVALLDAAHNLTKTPTDILDRHGRRARSLARRPLDLTIAFLDPEHIHQDTRHQAIEMARKFIGHKLILERVHISTDD